MHEPDYQSQGVFRQAGGDALWRVWAPFSDRVDLVTWPGGNRIETPMTPAGFGDFLCELPDVEEGLRYAYKLASGDERPDPASRWQPDGVHRPSAVFFPESYSWRDHQWRGVPRGDLVIYELHVGTFTPDGTFDAVISRLKDLVELGVTAIEIMPVAQFPGNRNWGYDGVHPFAAQNSYGGPRALQRLVEAAHREGLAVILDVVYNHLGPEGNYLGQFGPYFTSHYHTPWGNAVNFDGPESDPVRKFFIDNASMWVRDFHLDGLRLDAVHAIYDFSARHILAELQDAVQRIAAEQGRAVHVIAETHQNDVRLTDPPERGGFGLDGVWNDDFHHAVHSLLTGERDGYYQDFGRPEHLAKAYSDVFVYDGNDSVFRQRRHGSRVADRDRSQFVVFIQNHDQVGNRVLGDRFGTILPPEAQRLAAGLLMLAPNVPLLFMGEEYGETRPFPFFCSFGDPDLVEAVRKGRRQEFADLKFEWGTEIPDPQSEQTFDSARLTWQWPEESLHARFRRLYRNLLAARRNWPPLRDRQHTEAQVIGNDGPLLVLRRGSGTNKLTACANLTPQPRPLPEIDRAGREPMLSTAELDYGGRRELDRPIEELHPYELIVFGAPEWRTSIQQPNHGI